MSVADEYVESAIPSMEFDHILVLDFGSQYSHIIVRKLRDLHVYSEMLSCTESISNMGKPKGIILSGGPSSVYHPDAPHVDFTYPLCINDSGS